nr:hypothetical protein [Paracidovorax avenae]
MAAVVDDAQHLFARPHVAGQGRVVQRAHVAHAHPLQLLEQPRGLGRQFAHARQPAVERGRLQHGLRRGAEHDAGAVVARQFVDGGDAGLEQLERHGLRLVQHHHAAGNVVQLAALRGPRGEEAFEELHGRGDDDGCVPVLHGQAQLLGGLVFLRVALGWLALGEGAVVLQHGGIAQRAQGLAEHGGVLLDDAGERNDEDHALQPVADGVVQRESQRGQGLAAARGHGQREQPRGALGALADLAQDVRPQAVDLAGRIAFRRERAQVGVELGAQCGQGRPGRAGGAVVRSAPGLEIEALGVDEVGVHQAGKQHARQERHLEGLPRQGLLPVLPIELEAGGQRQPGGQGNVFFPGGMQRGQVGGRDPVRQRRALPLALPVGQARVVARDAIGHKLPHHAQALLGDACAPGGMVHAQGAAAQPRLEGQGVLAQVVQPAHDLGQLLRIEHGGEVTGHAAHGVQVLGQRLPAAFRLAFDGMGVERGGGGWRARRSVARSGVVGRSGGVAAPLRVVFQQEFPLDGLSGLRSARPCRVRSFCGHCAQPMSPCHPQPVLLREFPDPGHAGLPGTPVGDAAATLYGIHNVALIPPLRHMGEGRKHGMCQRIGG